MRALGFLVVLLLACPIQAEETNKDPLEDPVLQTLKDIEAPWYDAHRDTWTRMVRADDRNKESSGRRQGSSSGSGNGGDAEGQGGSPIHNTAGNSFLNFLIMAIFGACFLAMAALATMILLSEEDQNAPTPKRRDERQDEDAERLVIPHFLDMDLDEAARSDILAALKAARKVGDWNRAIVCCFAAILVTLAGKGFVTLEKGATNRRLLRQMQNHGEHELAQRFSTAIAGFEAIYFGGHQGSENDLAPLLALLSELRQPAVSQASQQEVDS